MAISTGCTTIDAAQKKRVISAAETIGQIGAQSIPTKLPEECKRLMERVIPKAGEKVRWTQKRWEFSADNIDAQIERCFQFDAARAKGLR